MSGHIADKKVLVVGASRGIGMGLTKELAGRGATVLATTRSDKAPDWVSGKIHWLPLDIRNKASTEAFIARKELTDLTDIVVVAGIMPKGVEEDPTDEMVSKVFLTNSVAPVLLGERLLKRLDNPPTQLMFLGSRMGSITLNETGDAWIYRASKAALLSAVKSLQALHASSLTQFTVIHPGWVRTDMGGSGAEIDVETSARGLADRITMDTPTTGFVFQDYAGNILIP